MRLSINNPRVNALKPTLRREVILCGSVAAAARKLSLILADHYYPYSMPEDAPKNLWRRRGRLFQTIITARLLYSILRPRDKGSATLVDEKSLTRLETAYDVFNPHHVFPLWIRLLSYLPRHRYKTPSSRRRVK